jgi:hypothetical protein
MDVWIEQNVLHNWESSDGIKCNTLWAIAYHSLIIYGYGGIKKLTTTMYRRGFGR